MDASIVENARKIMMAALVRLREIRTSWETKPTEAKQAFDSWHQALHRDLTRLLLRPPVEVFRVADEQSDPRERSGAYLLVLRRLIEDVRRNPETVLRGKVTKRVFIVHGHDETNLLRLKDLLREFFGVDPVVMKDAPAQARTLIEKLEHLAGDVEFVIVTCTPDDLVRGCDREYRQPRPNVLIEIGFFCARLDRLHVCVLLKEGTEVPTDVLGVHYYSFKDSVKELTTEIGRELRDVGLVN